MSDLYSVALGKLRVKMERQIGFGLTDSVWRRLVEKYGNDLEFSGSDGEDEYQEEFIDSCVDALALFEEGLKAGSQPKPTRKPRNASREGLYYAKSFNDRRDLWLFVNIERHDRRFFAFLDGRPTPPPLTWNELWILYKDAINVRTSLPFEYIPATAKAFEMSYRAADKEFGHLTPEDEAVWRLRDTLDMLDLFSQGYVGTCDGGMCRSFRAVREGRSAELLAEYNEQLAVYLDAMDRAREEDASRSDQFEDPDQCV